MVFDTADFNCRAVELVADTREIGVSPLPQVAIREKPLAVLGRIHDVQVDLGDRLSHRLLPSQESV
jgi:hypothetical protein